VRRGRDGARPGVVAVRDEPGVFALQLGEPRLRLAVALERAVAVEVVGRQVQQQCHVGVERARVLELEARQLGDHPRVAPAHERAQRRADVPAHAGGEAARLQHLADERGGGALAVRAGDAAELRVEVLRGEVDLGHELRVRDGRHTRARHHGVEAVVARRLRTRQREDAFGQPAQRLWAAVVDRHAGAGAQQEIDRGAPGARRAQHQNVSARLVHRSLSRERATSPRITEMIQKRTMICGSGQPRSS